MAGKSEAARESDVALSSLMPVAPARCRRPADMC